MHTFPPLKKGDLTRVKDTLSTANTLVLVAPLLKSRSNLISLSVDLRLAYRYVDCEALIVYVYLGSNYNTYNMYLDSVIY